MSHKTKQSELIKTTKLVIEHGVIKTAMILKLTPRGTTYRVRRLENQLGFRIFAPYDYGRVTWQGREYLKNENIDSM